MKLVQFFENGTIKLGVYSERGIIDIVAAAEEFKLTVPSTMEGLIRNGIDALKQLLAVIEDNDISAASYIHSEEEISYAACVTNPEKIICIGLNYKKHAEETKSPIPKTPVVFSKFANALTGHLSEISIPEGAVAVDYEVELAIVIGKVAKNVSKEAALEHVFGYCCANDLSEREWQLQTSQWVLGKTPDQFAPIGPYLVTAEEVGDPNHLELSCKVNGEIRQQSNTSDMFFRCDEIVSYLSKHMTLKPGDIILTGTPEGVVLGLPENERVYLKPGDQVEIEIEKLGKLVNVMS